MDVGLHRDVIGADLKLNFFNILQKLQSFSGELAKAVRADNHMRFGLYHSLFEWYNPMYLSDKNSSFEEDEFVEKKVGNSIC